MGSSTLTLPHVDTLHTMGVIRITNNTNDNSNHNSKSRTNSSLPSSNLVITPAAQKHNWVDRGSEPGESRTHLPTGLIKNLGIGDDDIGDKVKEEKEFINKEENT